MGTTRTSGWAVFWFLLGFTLIVTPTVGGGLLGFLAGAAMLAYSAVLFQAAKKKEASS
jgi:hypothetical protein